MAEAVAVAECWSTGQQAAVIQVFTCVFCRRSFTAYNELASHIVTTHPDMRPLPAPATTTNGSSQHHQCEICQTSFTSPRALRVHKRSHRPPIPTTVVIPPPPPPPIEAAGGMDSSESRSQRRRSSRLLAKSSMTVSQTTDKAPSTKRPKPKRLHPYRPGVFFVMGGPSAIPKFLQSQRKSRAYHFQRAYASKDARSDGWDKIIEKKFIVVSGGEKIHQQHVLPYDVVGCHGITWIGVHGINYICAVYLNKKPDRQCIVDWLKSKPLSSYFTGYVLPEMEDVADSPPYLETILKEPTVDSSRSQKTLKPFAVVSLPDTSNADEKGRQEVSTPSLKAQGEAIAYLKNELTGHSAYSMLQTQQIAIYAFQLLWEREFKAEEITVGCFYAEGGGGCDYRLGNLSCAKVSRCLETINQSVENEIEEQLDV